MAARDGVSASYGEPRDAEREISETEPYDFHTWQMVYGDEVESHPLEHTPMWIIEYQEYCKEYENEC